MKWRWRRSSWCRWIDEGWSGEWLPSATAGLGLNGTAKGKLLIGARRDTNQGGEVAVETLAIGRTHEREELMAGAHTRALSGRDVTTVGRSAAG